MHYREHPRGILNVLRIRLDVTVVESATAMHIDFMIIFEMVNEGRNVSGHRALGASVRTVVRSKPAVLLVLELAVVRENVVTP